MNKSTASRLLWTATLLASMAAPGFAPAYALDYQAKPVHWVITAPVRLVGAASAAIFCGAVNGPIDDGYHWSLKGTKHVAGKFGDEKGAGQLAVAAPIGGSVGLVLGAAYGIVDGIGHGAKSGWEKPFSRFSYITTDEDK